MPKPNFIKRMLGIKSPSYELEKALGNTLDVKTYSDLIKHFDRTHFTGVTVGGRKFVYCPVGNICSWSEGDYDHKWCHWCKKYFSEIGA